MTDYLSATVNIIYIRKEGKLDLNSEKIMRKVDEYTNTKINEYEVSTYLNSLEQLMIRKDIKNISGASDNVIKIEEFIF